MDVIEVNGKLCIKDDRYVSGYRELTLYELEQLGVID